MEKYFFDIPIYRCPVEKHTQELDNAKKARLQNLIDIHGPEVMKSESYKWVANDFDRVEWYPWRYNEVIGWIRLYAAGSQVKGELWFTNAKRIRRDLKRNRIYYRGKAFERTIRKNQASTEIIKIICEELAIQEKKYPVKGRYLDIETFCRIGEFINWRQLLRLEGIA